VDRLPSPELPPRGVERGGNAVVDSLLPIARPGTPRAGAVFVGCGEWQRLRNGGAVETEKENQNSENGTRHETPGDG
jgi:hypothetical protein